jgi:hypothetical protein
MIESIEGKGGTAEENGLWSKTENRINGEKGKRRKGRENMTKRKGNDL